MLLCALFKLFSGVGECKTCGGTVENAGAFSNSKDEPPPATLHRTPCEAAFADDLSALAGLLSNLQPGENVYDAIRQFANSQAYPEPSAVLKKEVWALFVCHAVVFVGIFARYVRGTGWLFARDSSGLIRPNTAVATQICFAVFSAYSLQSHPSTPAFIFLMLSYIPLGLALHVTVWATALAPTTSLSFLSNSPRGESKHARLTSALFIAACIFFPLSVIPSTVLMTLLRKKQFHAIDTFLAALDKAKADNVPVASALPTFLPYYTDINNIAARFLVIYRSLAGTYFGWIVIWGVIYVPTAIKLIHTLHSRKRRFLRSLRSLKVLDDIVTNDEEHQRSAGVPEKTMPPPSARWSRSPPQSPAYHSRSFTLPPLTAVQLAIRSGSPTDDASSITTEKTGTTAAEKVRSAREEFSDKMKEVGKKLGKERAQEVAQPSRAQTHIDDLELTLAKTQRMLTTILIQFVLTVIMALVLGSFAAFLFRSSLVTANNLFTSWTGWTFVVPGLIGSSVFALFSVRGPRQAPPPKPESKSQTTTEDEEAGDFFPLPPMTPVSPPPSLAPISIAQARSLTAFSTTTSERSPTTSASPFFPPRTPKSPTNPSILTRTFGAFHGRKASTTSLEFRDIASASGRNPPGWGGSGIGSGEPDDTISEVGTLEERSNPPSSVPPSPQRWVPSEWAQARSQGRPNFHWEEDEDQVEEQLGVAR
ncbi:hypothetical protein T439DRAFT_350589 [Meredithblackwellia eburnea MCA 4105]